MFERRWKSITEGNTRQEDWVTEKLCLMTGRNYISVGTQDMRKSNVGCEQLIVLN